MGKNVLISESILSSIGNILRSKLNTNISYTTSNIIDSINSIDTLWLNAMHYSKSIFTNIPTTIGDYNILKYIKNNFIINDVHLTSMPEEMLDGCTNVSYINIPNCSYIGDYAFRSCTNLSYISIPNCSYIGSNAFDNCTNLSSINIPNCSYIVLIYLIYLYLIVVI